MQTNGIADFPNPVGFTSGFWANIGDTFALLMIIGLMYPLANASKQLVLEKETKMRQVMLIMSLKTQTLFTTWAMHFVLEFLPLAILLTVVGQSLFEYSTQQLVFFYYFFFFLASLSFFAFVSVFFSSARTASIISSLLFFGGYVVYVGIYTSKPSKGTLLLACLHPSCAFTFGTLAFQEYEDKQIGVTRKTYNISEDYDITFLEVLTMLCVDTVLLLIMTWYASHVYSSDGSAALPWYFPFRSVWRFCSCQRQQAFGAVSGVSDQEADPGEGVEMRAVSSNASLSASVSSDDEEGVEGDDSDWDPLNPHHKQAPVRIERATPAMRALRHQGVVLDGLGKTFSTRTGPKTAVDQLSMAMYPDQITALLGHNGAGKSTTIAMLTGLVIPDQGTCTIGGLDLSTNLGDIRKSLGICPQHDIIFAELTVEEHLYLFANIKQVSPDAVAAEVDRMIDTVGLTEKRFVRSKLLSGGQKRKLSLGIAFLGDSRVVLLDEPTSGMDPYSRRATWDLIRQQKVRRILGLELNPNSASQLFPFPISCLLVSLSALLFFLFSFSSFFLLVLYALYVLRLLPILLCRDLSPLSLTFPFLALCYTTPRTCRSDA
jgi:ABC-type Na+ transport system ATPase subunit NatA